jgi:hypothetical protein
MGSSQRSKYENGEVPGPGNYNLRSSTEGPKWGYYFKYKNLIIYIIILNLNLDSDKNLKISPNKILLFRVIININI